MNEFQRPIDVSGACPACGEDSVSQKTVADEFDYGVEGSLVTLRAQVIVYTCDDCGLSFTDDSAARSRHEAICHHLGRLTPTDIRSLRNRLGLSQHALSHVTGFSEATIVRWETGSLIQSESSNRFLLLLEQFGVLETLTNIASNINQSEPGIDRPVQSQSRRFRVIDPQQFETRKSTFTLRLVG